MKHNNQRGFGVVGILVLIVTIVLIGFAAYYVINNKKDDKSPTANTSSVSNSEATSYSTYTNSEYGFTLEYPSTWEGISVKQLSSTTGAKGYQLDATVDYEIKQSLAFAEQGWQANGEPNLSGMGSLEYDNCAAPNEPSYLPYMGYQVQDGCVALIGFEDSSDESFAGYYTGQKRIVTADGETLIFSFSTGSFALQVDSLDQESLKATYDTENDQFKKDTLRVIQSIKLL